MFDSRHKVNYYGFANRTERMVGKIMTTGGILIAVCGCVIGYLSEGWLSREELEEVSDDGTLVKEEAFGNKKFNFVKGDSEQA